MSGVTSGTLYDLLPSHIRVRDDAVGLPLRALISIIEREVGRLDDNVQELHDNWFIETCSEWLVPYLGDLLRVRGLVFVEEAPLSQRAVVANTISYRRAKGTASLLERLSRDVTGWHAVAVEFFQRLATTQYLNHLRPECRAWLDVRRQEVLSLVGTPFDRAQHTADLRHIDRRRGVHNIPNVGIFAWRLQNYTLEGVTARRVGAPGQGRFTFHPAGVDQALFNLPAPRRDGAATGPHHVPGPLSRWSLYRELEERRLALEKGSRHDGARYFPPRDAGEKDGFTRDPVLRIAVDGEPVRPEELAVCDLSDWARPAGDSDTKAAVDPELGRITLPEEGASREHSVVVGYTYGFSGDVGGGPYDRDRSVRPYLTRSDDGETQLVGWQLGVSESAGEQLVGTLVDAVAQWNARTAREPLGVLTIMDSRTYAAPATIEVGPGERLIIAAADWPRDGRGSCSKGRIEASGLRPHVVGDLEVRMPGEDNAGELVLDGLSIEGRLVVQPGHGGLLRVSNCTIGPPGGGVEPRIEVESPSAAPNGTDPGDNAALRVEIERTITGSVRTPRIHGVCMRDSIVDGGDGPAFIIDTHVEIEACTVFGSGAVLSLDASNTLFTSPVVAERRQTGCVRFCYLADGSIVPRRHRCLPRNETGLRDLRPHFTSRRHADPGHAQLASTVPEAIRRGADDRGELGAFHFLQSTQRVDNLRAALDEYLRFGLEAGILYVT